MSNHQSDNGRIELSVVIPLFNEQDNVTRLMERLLLVLETMEVVYEIILVDDGSGDNTWGLIKQLADANSAVKGLALARNFGHQNAMLAGLETARGLAVVTMDGDLQHPPEMLAEMVAAWSDGYMVVNTKRRDQAVTSTFKRLTSKWFYRIFSLLTDISMVEGSSDFRLLDRRVLQEIKRFQDAEFFLRGVVQWLGFSSTTLPFVAESRFAGESKFDLRRMLSFAAGAVLSFSNKPLRIGIWLGVITSLIAFTEIVYVVIRFLHGDTVSGWASTVGIISFLFGVLFIMLGIIGAYLARIHRTLQSRPKFVVGATINVKPDAE